MNWKQLLLSNINTKQIVIKNTFWLLVSEIVSKTPTFLLGFLIIRYLGAKDYGKLSFAFSFGALFSALADLGISTLATREIAKNQKLAKKYLGNFLILKSILALIVLVLIILGSQLLGKPPETERIIYLVAGFIVASSFLVFLQSIFQGFEKMEYLVVSKLSYSLFLIIFVLLTIKLDLGLSSITASYLYSALIAVLITLKIVRQRFAAILPEIDINFWKESITNSWPFGLINLLGSIYLQTRIIQLNLIAGDKETGFYNAAYQFIFILTTLTGTVFSALFPTLSRSYYQSKKSYYQTINYVAQRTIIFSLLFCFFLFILSRPLITFLYGKGYSQSSENLRFLSIAVFFTLLHTPFSEGLKILNKQKDYLKILLMGFVFNFLLNFPLIKLKGSTGAAISTLIASLLIAILMIIKFMRFKKEDLKKNG